jgi:hypothetical protein
MKYFLALILSFVVVTCSASDLLSLLEHQTWNIAYDVQLPDTGIAANDFSKRYPTSSQVAYIHMDESSEPMDASSIGNDWYPYDFASDPFDGIIEVLVVGEPLPSPTTTLIIALGFMILVYCKRCYLDCPTVR